MAKSKRPPSLGKSAGAKLTVIRLCGNSKPELIMALRTLSFASRTEVSGSPTIVKEGNPLDKCTSIVTKGAFIPTRARLNMIASDIFYPSGH